MDMPAVQTYDNGLVVNWNQPVPASGAEPEHPVPHLALLTAAQAAAATNAATVNMANMTTTGASATSTDGTARWLGGLGLLLGALALGFGLGAYFRSKRAGDPGPGPDDDIDDDDDDDDLADEAPPEEDKTKQGASA
jgi:hypothetical protein